jgi:hypothetical protein
LSTNEDEQYLSEEHSKTLICIITTIVFIVTILSIMLFLGRFY